MTLCTYGREDIFGVIKNDQMFLNKYGQIAEDSWREISNHFPYVKLDEHIIMPNHIHGIVIITNAVGDGHARPANDQSNLLSVIIDSYKSAVTKRINRMRGILFCWQRSYYDQIIRAEEALNKTREYIIHNPLTWSDDNENIKNRKDSGQACLSPTG